MALFERHLIEKYNRPGPRYTSYPTAPHLKTDFGDEQFTAVLLESNKTGRPLSLYVHIPFCKSLCLFCACNALVTRRRERISEYLDYLERDIESTANLVETSRTVSQLHWGGGTPSYLDPDEIRRLAVFLRSRFNFADDIEASVEIDPRNVGATHIESFKEAGFNRMSLGIQDVDPKVQRAVNRIQPFEETQRVFSWCREAGIPSVNVDLMYGLPHQAAGNFAAMLEAVLDLAPDRIALFNYAHVPWMKRHQRALSADDMPSAEERIRILGESIGTLTAAGYVFIGMDHFAKPSDELAVAQRNGTLWRNFQGYTTHGGCDLLGFGITSLGLFENAYYQREKELTAYYAAIDGGGYAITRGLMITDVDRLRRHVIMELMCHFKLNMQAVEERFGIEFWTEFSSAREALRVFEEDGLVEISDGWIRVTESGRLLIRNVAMSFDAYLGQPGQGFSKTV